MPIIGADSNPNWRAAMLTDVLLCCAYLKSVTAIVLCYALSIASAAAQVTLPACPEPPPGALNFGFTLTHFSVDTTSEPRCRNEVSGGSTINGENNIIGHYDDPAVRSRVAYMLRRMNASGASVLRTITWFRHVEDEAMSRRTRDPLGLLIAKEGKLEPRVLDNLTSYVRDARLNGYRRMILVLSAQGKANPKCRHGREWGACYDDRLIHNTWSVIAQVVSHLQSADLAGMEMTYDISPTSCVPEKSKLDVDRKLEAYSRYMVMRYQQKFQDSKFITSCGGANDKRAADGVIARAKMFREMGVKPAAIDLHLYETDRDEAIQLGKTANDEARALGVPLIIAETYFDHPSAFELIRSRRSELPQLSTMLVFPRLTSSACQFSVAPPYALEPIVRTVGNVAEGCPLIK